MLSLAFQTEFDIVPACVKTEEGRRFLVILHVINFSRFSSQSFRGARQDADEH